MTKAERAVSSGKVPTALKSAAEEVSTICIEGYERMEAAPKDDPIHQVHEYHGLHAYRYSEMSDDSVLALYANDASGEIKMKAFEDMEAASAWTPRSERNGG